MRLHEVSPWAKDGVSTASQADREHPKNFSATRDVHASSLGKWNRSASSYPGLRAVDFVDFAPKPRTDSKTGPLYQ